MRPVELLREPLTRLWSSALSVRILNILDRMQIEYLEQFDGVTKHDLLKEPNFGDQCLVTLMAALEEFDMGLADVSREELTAPEDSTYERNLMLEKNLLRRIAAPKLRTLVTVAERMLDNNPKLFTNVQLDSIKAAIYDARRSLSQPIEVNEED